MLKCTCRFDFDDIPDVLETSRATAVSAMDKVGKEAVEFARQNGSYRDVTGYLRSRNQYKADGDKLTLFNDAPYAAAVESRGKDVLNGAALFAESKLKQ